MPDRGCLSGAVAADDSPGTEYSPSQRKRNQTMNRAPEQPADAPRTLAARRAAVLSRMANAEAASHRPVPAALLAVSKTQDASRIRSLAQAGQRAFGENYVREALDKRPALEDLALEWHLIGPLQSNKAKLAAMHFDWVQSVDRPKLVAALARHRPLDAPPLNILIQVNVDGEAGKSGCAPSALDELADAVTAQGRLRLRGLMAIPAPSPEASVRRDAFRTLKRLFDQLAARTAGIDTLSMGMSEDFELAIAEGATLIRVGSALFGPRDTGPT